MKHNRLFMALLLCSILIPINSLKAQNGVAINTDGTSANSSAMLDVKSTSKGILIPRLLLTERTAIASPATGLLVYQTDGVSGFYYYDGASWKFIGNTTNGDNLGDHTATMNLNLGAYSLVGNSGTTGITISNGGNVGINGTVTDGASAEKLRVDAGTNGSYNVIGGYGNRNGYLQVNIKNSSNGNTASSDIVATADNGDESTNYIDMGINSSTYNNSSYTIGGADDAYLYNVGQNLAIGTASSGKVLSFHTGGTLAANLRMRIDGNGNVGIGTSSNTTGAKFDVSQTSASSSNNYAIHGISNGVSLINTNYAAYFVSSNAINNYGVYGEASGILSGTSYGGRFKASTSLAGTLYGIYSEASGASGTAYAIYSAASGATTNYSFYGQTGTLFNSGSVGIGTNSFTATYTEKLKVDAGSTGNTNYQNVIVGLGNTNSYAQINIKNQSSGNGASSDIVATADNGNESANYIDMGINSSTYNNSSYTIGGANDAYLYNVGQDLAIGTATTSKYIAFHTGGTLAANERMRIDGSGNVGIGATNPNSILEINGATTIDKVSSTPTCVSGQTVTYTKGNYFVIMYNDAGTYKFRYMDLTSTAASWIYSTTAP